MARKLAAENRPADGKLHPSGDLLGSLRHSQLRAAGAPTIEEDLVSAVRLMTGTMWHSYFESIFRGLPVMAEVKLDKWLPEGWSGTADWVIWDDERGGFVLGDLKTLKGEGIPWIRKKGIKEEHQWQVSAYWYALYEAGLPLVDEYIVYYLPQNQVFERGGLADVRPLTLTGKPITEKLLTHVMNDRWNKTEQYLAHIPGIRYSLTPSPEAIKAYAPEQLVNKFLAPVQPRVVKRKKNYQNGNTDVILVPHWSATYCPYPTELCDCREQGQTKIGHYDQEGVYVPRRGYEDYDPSTGAIEVSGGS